MLIIAAAVICVVILVIILLVKKKETPSHRYQKQLQRVFKKTRHATNQRKDFLHKQSTMIAKSYDAVCVEVLNLTAIANKGFGNSKATMDNGYGMFLVMLAYKLAKQGKRFIKIDRWYASSQLCSACGNKNPLVKDLHIREWTCPHCGARHDRDWNAAKNIRKEGLRILQETA